MQIIWKSEERIVNNMFNQYWRSLYWALWDGITVTCYVLCSARQFVFSAPLIRQTFSISSFSHGTPHSIVSPLTLSLWNPTSAGQTLFLNEWNQTKSSHTSTTKYFCHPKNNAVVAKLSRTEEYFKHCLFDDIIPMRGEQCDGPWLGFLKYFWAWHIPHKGPRGQELAGGSPSSFRSAGDQGLGRRCPEQPSREAPVPALTHSHLSGL